MKHVFKTLRAFAPALLIASTAQAARGFVQDLTSLKVPPGFSIAMYATGLPDARSLALSPDGTVFVSSRTEGRLYALADAKHDGRPEHLILTDQLDTPNGIDVYKGDLYIAEKTRLLKISNIEKIVRTWKDGQKLPIEVLRSDLPSGDDHGWRYLRARDGWLYVSIGAPCNVCLRDQDAYAVIVRFSLDGKTREVVARGVRNSEGFDFAPKGAGAGAAGSLWFTDNGRDMMGDDRPDDELNHVSKQGQHFGFPFCHQGNIPDPEFAPLAPRKKAQVYDPGKVCDPFTAPEQRLGAHVAALGMRFYEGDMFPSEYRHRIFIAEHGSWNRSTPVGYRVMSVVMKDGHPVNVEPFVTGWFDENSHAAGGNVTGRPVDVQPLKDGSLLISDDKAGTIYRLTYTARLRN